MAAARPEAGADARSATPRKRAPRQDAQKRREALIAAAARIFASHGYSVPLEKILEEAGVGRGTLYRNFRDREALALAIFAREVDRFEATLDPTATIAETITTMVRDGAPATSLFARIAGELHMDDANLAAFRSLGDRLEAIIAPVVALSQRRGELSPAATARDVVLAMRMASGLVLPFMNEAELSAQVGQTMRLLFEGLRPR